MKLQPLRPSATAYVHAGDEGLHGRNILRSVVIYWLLSYCHLYAHQDQFAIQQMNTSPLQQICVLKPSPLWWWVMWLEAVPVLSFPFCWWRSMTPKTLETFGSNLSIRFAEVLTALHALWKRSRTCFGRYWNTATADFFSLRKPLQSSSHLSTIWCCRSVLTNSDTPPEDWQENEQTDLVGVEVTTWLPHDDSMTSGITGQIE